MSSTEHRQPKHYGPGDLQTYLDYSISTPESSDVHKPTLESKTTPKHSEEEDLVWVIYVHGGAWRDPSQDHRTAVPTVTKLRTEKHKATTEGKIAGLLSINYRLSPYASHPSNPSSPADTQRNARHPDHVQDVTGAIHFLKKEYGIKRWIGVGHSCGATLLCQLVSSPGLETAFSSSADPRAGLEALILLEGIYDIPLLLKNHQPPACPEKIAQIYHDFVEGAFGEDGEGEEVYRGASPTSGGYGWERWRDGRLVVLGYSNGDELVEPEQRDVLVTRFKEESWAEKGQVEDEDGKVNRVVEVRDLKGGHDEIWEDGSQIADLIVDVVDRLSK
ncbi:hypothetical protein P280DRAFT_49769 [Massarina eburnea CBS 473.64]|uniref:Kynurenine formamidase n=1 Tax=Massarina eburnea CBS 473.64 TaxID=1395130 RepID=A0A6A6RW94_9PLEO|nr:hypothetical protein P280DRAFT_49769 [Massarina eburnea CBS 473.64]